MPGDRHRVRLDAGGEPQPQPAEPATVASSFDLLVLGDFSGRGVPGGSPGEGPPLEERSPVPIDRDDFDGVLATLGPELRLELPAGDAARTIRARFQRLADFHPDELVRRLDAFGELVGLRRRLGRGAPSGRTGSGNGLEGPGAPDRGEPSAEPRSRPTDDVGEPPDPEGDGGDGGPGGGPAADAGLLDQVVSSTEGSGAGPDRPPEPVEPAPGPGSDDAFSEYLRDLVRPHLVPDEEPDAGERALRDRLEGVLRDGMRALLHHPGFQALESSWRGLSFLVHRVETGSGVRIRLLDISKRELARDLERAARGGDSTLARTIVEERAATPGADPWALLVGLYTFGPDDAGLLGRLAELARSAGAPFLAGAAPSLAGVPSYARRPSRADWEAPGGGEAWRELRRSRAASGLGLALPRFMLRLPYGPDDAPCEAFPFREMTSPPRHEDYLWGNSALLCAALLAESWAREGQDMRPGSRREVDRLPLHIYSADGGAEAKPCAEMLMTDSVAAEFLERGFIPVASVKERDAVRVVRFQSIAAPPTALAGRWTSGAG